MTKRKIFVSALAICLIAIISMGTLAWYSDSDSATNTFKFADSTDDPDELFSVNVYEQKDGQTYDDPTGITYDDVVPGATYEKDAFVENTGKYDQYIRVTATLSDLQAWMGALDITSPAAFETYDIIANFPGFDETIWEKIEKNVDVGNDTITYVLYLKDALTPGSSINLFDEVVLPGATMDQTDAVAFGGDFTIDIKAEAVQTEFVGDTCYAAFQTVLGA